MYLIQDVILLTWIPSFTFRSARPDPLVGLLTPPIQALTPPILVRTLRTLNAVSALIPLQDERMFDIVLVLHPTTWARSPVESPACLPWMTWILMRSRQTLFRKTFVCAPVFER